jgi:hypothetical protein
VGSVYLNLEDVQIGTARDEREIAKERLGRDKTSIEPN